MVRYHRQGERAARDELIAHFVPLARSLARRYYHGREPLEDLVQVACMGLIKAADRFEVDRGTSFTSFAVPSKIGELRRHFRDSGWLLHVPRGLQERTLEVERATEQLTAELLRAPSAAEIATAIGKSVEDVLEALTVSRARDVLSLDAPRATPDGELEPRAERLPSEEPGYELVEYRSAVAARMHAVPRGERVAIGLRFMRDMTQSEIAAQLGVSQMQVSRLVRRGLSTLQQAGEQDRCDREISDQLDRGLKVEDGRSAVPHTSRVRVMLWQW